MSVFPSTNVALNRAREIACRKRAFRTHAVCRNEQFTVTTDALEYCLLQPIVVTWQLPQVCLFSVVSTRVFCRWIRVLGSRSTHCRVYSTSLFISTPVPVPTYVCPYVRASACARTGTIRRAPIFSVASRKIGTQAGLSTGSRSGSPAPCRRRSGRPSCRPCCPPRPPGVGRGVGLA